MLSRRGVLRWLALAVFAATPVAVLVIYAFANLLWVAAVAAAAWLLAGVTGRAALAEDKADWRMPEFAAVPARHPFLIMNPRSGGGKVGKFDLQRKAEALGAEVFLMSGPGPSTWPRSRGRRSRAAPTCSASRAATAPRRWWPASPPSTASRSW